MNSGARFRKVFITGASSGIGRAVAKQLAGNGSELVLAARRRDLLGRVCGEINDSEGSAAFTACDVTNAESVAAAVDFAFETLGGIDLAIVNAGVMGSEPIISMDVDKARAVFDVNVFGMLNTLTTLARRMKGSGATIAIVTSLADARGFPYSSSYSASKAAASHFAEAARIELKKEGINVVTIKPGFVETDMTAKNKFYMPFLMPVERAARIIVDGLESGRKRISFPLPTAVLSWVAKAIPAALFESIFSLWHKNNNTKKESKEQEQ